MSCTFSASAECDVGQGSVSKQRLDEGTQPPVANCQDSRWHGNEDDVGKSSNDQKKLSRGASVVVEIVDRDNAGSPRCNEEHYESENHLEKHAWKELSETPMRYQDLIKCGYLGSNTNVAETINIHVCQLHKWMFRSAFLSSLHAGSFNHLPPPHLGCSSLSRHPFYDRCVLHWTPHPTVGVERVEGAQVGKGHEDYRNCFMDHHRCGGIGQATVAGGKVPHTAQQGARCATHQH